VSVIGFERYVRLGVGGSRKIRLQLHWIATTHSCAVQYHSIASLPLLPPSGPEARQSSMTGSDLASSGPLQEGHPHGDLHRGRDGAVLQHPPALRPHRLRCARHLPLPGFRNLPAVAAVQ